MSIVKWAIDPGLEGDPYADKPYLYGPALSSINVLRVGQKPSEAAATAGTQDGDDGVIEEGADGNGQLVREENRVPDAAPARQKWFLQEQNRKQWVFEAGRLFQMDFFNPYLDFNGEFCGGGVPFLPSFHHLSFTIHPREVMYGT